MAKRKNIYFVTMKFENVEYGTQTTAHLLIKARSSAEARVDARSLYLYDYATENFKEKNKMISCNAIEFDSKTYMVIPNSMIT